MFDASGKGRPGSAIGFQGESSAHRMVEGDLDAVFLPGRGMICAPFATAVRSSSEA
jgi:hypothetical protein